MQFTIVSPEGEILSSGECSEDQFDLLKPSVNHKIYPFLASPETHYFNGEELIAYSENQAMLKAEYHPGMTWDNESMSWIDTRDVYSTRIARLIERKELRDQEEYGGFEWGGSRFDSDPISQSRISFAALGAMTALTAGTPFLQTWTLADNTTRELNALEMIEVAQALGAHIATAHAKGRIMREQLNNAVNLSQLDDISWPT